MRNERFFYRARGLRSRTAPTLGRPRFWAATSSGPVAMAATVARAGAVAVMYVWRC